jgi:hypothetical protein
MGGGLVFGLISARVWEFLFLLSFFDSFGRVHRREWAFKEVVLS